VILKEQFECGGEYVSESEDKFWEQIKKWEPKKSGMNYNTGVD